MRVDESIEDAPEIPYEKLTNYLSNTMELENEDENAIIDFARITDGKVTSFDQDHILNINTGDFGLVMDSDDESQTAEDVFELIPIAPGEMEYFFFFDDDDVELPRIMPSQLCLHNELTVDDPLELNDEDISRGPNLESFLLYDTCENEIVEDIILPVDIPEKPDLESFLFIICDDRKNMFKPEEEVILPGLENLSNFPLKNIELGSLWNDFDDKLLSNLFSDTLYLSDDDSTQDDDAIEPITEMFEYTSNADTYMGYIFTPENESEWTINTSGASNLWKSKTKEANASIQKPCQSDSPQDPTSIPFVDCNLDAFGKINFEILLENDQKLFLDVPQKVPEKTTFFADEDVFTEISLNFLNENVFGRKRQNDTTLTDLQTGQNKKIHTNFPLSKLGNMRVTETVEIPPQESNALEKKTPSTSSRSVDKKQTIENSSSSEGKESTQSVFELSQELLKLQKTTKMLMELNSTFPSSAPIKEPNVHANVRTMKKTRSSTDDENCSTSNKVEGGIS
ncbi:DgyrCDS999 [Dimorphilus gyrociliatus]|nr:DgyrCDS999 [Dimorphilus gyrociliatus]